MNGTAMKVDWRHTLNKNQNPTIIAVGFHPFHEWNGNEGGLAPYVE
jgi:hypothetical protein